MSTIWFLIKLSLFVFSAGFLFSKLRHRKLLAALAGALTLVFAWLSWQGAIAAVPSWISGKIEPALGCGPTQVSKMRASACGDPENVKFDQEIVTTIVAIGDKYGYFNYDYFRILWGYEKWKQTLEDLCFHERAGRIQFDYSNCDKTIRVEMKKMNFRLYQEYVQLGYE